MSKKSKLTDFLVGATSFAALVGAGLLSIEAERQVQNNRSRFAEEYLKKAKCDLPKNLDDRRYWAERRIRERAFDSRWGMGGMSEESRNIADNIDRMLAGV